MRHALASWMMVALLLGACGDDDGGDGDAGGMREDAGPRDGGGGDGGPMSDTGPVPDGGMPPASSAFFAPARPSGRIEVRLHPTEGIGGEQLVSFGVPFPRGSLREPDLARVRVLAGGAEIPAHVEMLTPWRHATDPSLDGVYVRVALVQIRRTIAASFPAFDTVEVEWGTTARTMDVAAREDVRSGWHAVTGGSYTAADGIEEPNVYAVLPAATLAAGALRPMPMDPFDAEVVEARDDPAVMDATEHYPGFREQQHAHKNFFYTAIGQDDPAVTPDNECPYRTVDEPWLYDRAATFFHLYFRSGFFIALREAVLASQFYAAHLYPPGTTPSDAVGAFDLKNPDPAAYIGANGIMYSYSENLAYTHWVTGDPEVLGPIEWVSKGQEDATDEPSRWSSGTAYTERHIGFRLLAHAVAYEVLGDRAYVPGGASYATLVRDLADNLIWHQDGAGGAVPADRVDGALWKYGRQQGDGPADAWVASPWLSAILVDAMVRVYAQTERDDVASFIRRMGTFLVAASDPIADEEYGTGMTLRKVDYVTLIDGSTYAADGANGEHALEVAGALAWAHFFAELGGTPDPTFAEAARGLYETYDYSVNYWTRPAAPASGVTAYRLTVGACRKLSWEHRPSGSLSWAVRADLP